MPAKETDLYWERNLSPNLSVFVSFTYMATQRQHDFIPGNIVLGLSKTT